MKCNDKWNRNEKYSADKNEILEHIATDDKLKPAYIYTKVFLLKQDQAAAQEAFDLAETNQRASLTTLIEKL
jgi:hypothetical protein